MAEDETQEETQETQEVPDGYIPEDEVRENYVPKDEVFDKHVQEGMERGKKQLARSLGLNPDNVDLSSEESIRQAYEEKREAEKNLDAERIEKVKEQVKAEYEPYKEENQKLKRRLAETEIVQEAERVGFTEDVTDGDWKDDFVEDVMERTKLTDEFGRVVVDENGDPVPSSDPDKTYKTTEDLLEEWSQDSRWSTFASGQPQKTDSGYNESSSPDTSVNQTKADFTDEERREFIKENGAAAWTNLPDE
jgi:hypothetical protein